MTQFNSNSLAGLKLFIKVPGTVRKNQFDREPVKTSGEKGEEKCSCREFSLKSEKLTKKDSHVHLEDTPGNSEWHCIWQEFLRVAITLVLDLTWD